MDLLTPVVKAWCTDNACHVASLGMQVHGGMGFVEETGAAQYYRDARILPIYEGTNGIQAADLVFRKVARDGGGALTSYVQTMRARTQADGAMFEPLFVALESATAKILEQTGGNPDWAAAAATPYLKGLGILAGGALMAQSIRVAQDSGEQAFSQSIIQDGRYYLGNVLPLAGAYFAIAQDGSAWVQ